MHRSIKIAAVSTALALAVTACGSGGGGGEADTGLGDTLTVGWYGGPIGEAFKKVVVEPFQEATGVKVTVETAFDDPRLAKLQANPGALDVAFFQDAALPKVRSAGLSTPISEQDVPRLSDVYPQLRSEDAFSWTFGVWGIAYNADKVSPAPTSWNDLLKPEYKGHVTAPDITYNSSILTLAAFAELNGGSLANLDAGFAKMRELKHNAQFLWPSSSQMLQQLQAGSIWLTPYASGGAYEAAGAPGAPPIKFVVPEEGGYFVNFNAVVPKGAKHTEAAYAFLNHVLDPKVQAAWAEEIYYAPANRTVQIPESVADKVLSSDEVNQQVKNIDWKTFDTTKAEIVDRWRREVK